MFILYTERDSDTPEEILTQITGSERRSYNEIVATLMEEANKYRLKGCRVELMPTVLLLPRFRITATGKVFDNDTFILGVGKTEKKTTRRKKK